MGRQERGKDSNLNPSGARQQPNPFPGIHTRFGDDQKQSFTYCCDNDGDGIRHLAEKKENRGRPIVRCVRLTRTELDISMVESHLGFRGLRSRVAECM